MSDASEEAATTRRVGAAALLLIASNLLSRVLGYGRDVLLAYLFGASTAADAYNAAFIIPDWLNHLLAGGVLSIAFLPQYTARRVRGDAEGAERFLGLVLGTLGALAVLLTLGLWLASDQLVEAERIDAARLHGLDARVDAADSRLPPLQAPSHRPGAREPPRLADPRGRRVAAVAGRIAAVARRGRKPKSLV